MPNKSQSDALDKMSAFLMGSDDVFLITGGPGYGKTFLIKHIFEKRFDEYQKLARILGKEPLDGILISATTHAAAEVHEKAGVPCSTIHSLLSLFLKLDYATGEEKLFPKSNAEMVENKLIVIDEYTMINWDLKKYMQKHTRNCKFILVGDADQLLFVKGTEPLWTTANTPHAVLDIPMRTKSPSILAATEFFKSMVHQNITTELTIGDDVLYLDPPDVSSKIADLLHVNEEFKVLAFVNDDVVWYNNKIRSMLGLPSLYTPGEKVVNNKAVSIQQGSNKVLMRTDEKLEISSYSGIKEVVFPDKSVEEVHQYTVNSDTRPFPVTVNTAVDPRSYNRKLNALKKKKNFQDYYRLCGILDLRPPFASTVYKAQGNTIGTVIVDLESFPPNMQLDVLARALFVSVSRAQNKVYLVGNLHQRLLDKF